MSRVAQPFSKNQLIALLSIVFVFGASMVAGISVHEYHKSQPQITVVASQTTDVKYAGVAGQTALALLEKYEPIQTKHYSFGDLVVSINGTPGNGPKYWSFYVNGKMATVGAGAYITKDGDSIEWKLQ